MRSSALIAAALLLVLAPAAQAADCSGRTTLLWRPQALAAEKARIAKDSGSVPAYAAR